MAKPVKIAFVALGCAKNLVDSEKMLAQLAERGALITPDEAEADVIVINTCGFLGAARAEAHEEIADAVALKKKGRCKRVVVAGCLVQRDGADLLDAIPGIDAIVGVHRRDEVADVALDLPRNRKKGRQRRQKVDSRLGDYHPYVALDTARLRLTPRHYAYLRISEGCDQKCTFCTIPAIRGPMHSKPVPIVLDEARELAGDGVVELNVIGQDTTRYGRDLGDEAGLAGLLAALNGIDRIEWIRLLYAYPSVFTDEMIDAIGQCDKVVKYVDLPLQHINDRILKAMGRGVTRAETEVLLRKLRDRIPGVAIRTTFISGFPGETEGEFEELLDFVRDFKFSAVGVFPYSLEPDTPAGRMTGQWSEAIRQERADAIMEAQQTIAFTQAKACTGQFLDVLIDGTEDIGRFVGRHAGQAPEVDSVTYVLADDLEPGQLVRAIVEDAKGYDLIARPTNAILPIRT